MAKSTYRRGYILSVMCGGANFQIGNQYWQIYLGYYGNYLTIEDEKYSNVPFINFKELGTEGTPEDETRKKLGTFTKDELIEAIISMVKYGDER